jgi:hypothetical protein
MRRLAFLLLLLPTLAHAQPSPEDYRDVRQAVDVPVFTGGAATFSLTYGISAVAAAGTHNRDLYVPLAGPWIALADRRSCPATGACDNETTKKILLVADGVFQAAGAVAMVEAWVSPPHRTEAVQAAKLDTKLHFRPSLVGMHSDPGFAVSGRF